MNVEEVQRRLWGQSRMHRQRRTSGTPLFPANGYDGRARNLMDLMHHPHWLRAAADRVLRRSHNKAPGVDGVATREFRKGLDGKLESLRLELKRGTYQSQPVRRVMIPKANGKMRALGIPCLRDKIVQEAIRMALEPIFEVEFATVRLRHNRTKGSCGRIACLTMVWKLMESAGRRWRLLRGSTLLPDVLAGVVTPTDSNKPPDHGHASTTFDNIPRSIISGAHWLK